MGFLQASQLFGEHEKIFRKSALKFATSVYPTKWEICLIEVVGDSRIARAATCIRIRSAYTRKGTPKSLRQGRPKCLAEILHSFAIVFNPMRCMAKRVCAAVTAFRTRQSREIVVCPCTILIRLTILYHSRLHSGQRSMMCLLISACNVGGSNPGRTSVIVIERSKRAKVGVIVIPRALKSMR